MDTLSSRFHMIEDPKDHFPRPLRLHIAQTFDQQSEGGGANTDVGTTKATYAGVNIGFRCQHLTNLRIRN